MKLELWTLRETKAPSTVTALDPGTEAGGLVTMHGRRVIWTLDYQRRGKGPTYDVVISTDKGRELATAANLKQALNMAPHPGRSVWVTEDLQPHGRVRGFPTLARSAGVGDAWAMDYGLLFGKNPSPSTWRTTTLGIASNTDAVSAARAAVAACRSVPALGSRRHVRFDLMGMPAEFSDHVADAVAIALWAQGYQLVSA